MLMTTTRRAQTFTSCGPEGPAAGATEDAYLAVVDRHFYASEMLEPDGSGGRIPAERRSGGPSLSAQDAASRLGVAVASSAVGRLGDIECKYLNSRSSGSRPISLGLSKNRVSYGTLAPEELRARESRAEAARCSVHRQGRALRGVGVLATRSSDRAHDPASGQGHAARRGRAMLRGLRDDFAQQHGVSSKRPAALATRSSWNRRAAASAATLTLDASDASHSAPLLANF